MRLLIVDDDPFRASILARQLGSLGYKDITGVTSGEEALRLIRTQTFDLVITDWHMRGLSGLGIALHTRDGGKRTPIIMLLSKGIPEEVLVARMVGVDEFIMRPVTLEVLNAKITKVLGEARLGEKQSP